MAISGIDEIDRELIALLQADLSGQDGVKLAVDFGSPVVRLGPGLGVALSPARPNPLR